MSPTRSHGHWTELPQDLRPIAFSHRGTCPSRFASNWHGPCREWIESTQHHRRSLGDVVQDALGQLRLDMKYLMFDLEATRRERDDYRQRLEQI